MGKKKSTALVPVKKASDLVIGPAARARALQAADAAWDKALTDAMKAYDAAMSAAWTRYIGALRTLGAIQKSLYGTPRYKEELAASNQCKKEEESALRVWFEAGERMDKKLKATLDAITGDYGDAEPTDESE